MPEMAPTSHTFTTEIVPGIRRVRFAFYFVQGCGSLGIALPKVQSIA